MRLLCSRVGMSVLAVLTLSTEARADPLPQESSGPNERQLREDQTLKEDAYSAFVRGRELFNRKDYARALASLRRSYHLYPRFGTLFNMALCEEHLGMIASAWKHFFVLTPQLSEQDARRSIAGERMAALAPRLPRLRLALSHGAPEAVSITINGLNVPSSALGTYQPLDPGGHVIVVTAPGRAERLYDLTIVEGQLVEIAVQPGPEIYVAPKKTLKAGPGKVTSGFVAGLVITSVGAVGLAGGIVAGALSVKYKNDASDACPSNSHCSEAAMAISERSDALEIATILSLSFAVPAFGVGLWAVANGGRASHSAAVLRPIPVPSGIGFGVQGAF
jgi:tetratricopeptide (TPR) repeat protein